MFSKLFNAWAMKKQVAEAKHFLNRIKAMNSDELGLPLVGTHAAAEILQEEKGLNAFDPFSVIANFPGASLFYSQLASKLQKMDRQLLAPGAMVWAHTFRGTVNHEVRNLSREIWGELLKGEPHAEDARDDLMTLYQMWPDLSRISETPIGFETK